MKVNKRGFTLIEILAVIVILAVLAVITIPIVMGIIEETRKDRFLENVKSVVASVEQYNSEHDMKAIGQYVVNQTDIQYIEDREFDTKMIPVKGEFDGSGLISLNKSGLVRLQVENDTWCVFGTNKDYRIEKGKCSEVANPLLPTYKIDKVGWAPKKTVTITYPEREEGLIFDYSLDGGKTWIVVKTGNEKKIEFTQPGTIVARVYDGLSYQTASTFSVTQIDSTPPEDVAIAVTKKTTNSITVTTTGEDKESGIGTIYYSKDNGKTWENAGAGKTYTFKKLKTGSYQLKARVVNGAGLETTSNVVSATTNDIIPPTYAVDKTGWQPKKIVTITYPAREEDFVYQYSLDGGKSWKEVASPETKQQITFTANGTVIARITDGVNYKTASSFAVTQIDTTPPTSVIAMGGRTSNSITLKATCTDDKSGISKIEYSKDNGKTYVDGGTKDTYTFNNLSEGSYYFKARCTNGAGLKSESATLSGNPLELITPTYAIDKTGWQPKKVVTITFQARESNYVYQYSLDGGRSWTTVPAPLTQQQVTFTTNGTLIARVTDGVNYKTASSLSITQVDSSAPSATVSVASKTSNSANLSASCVDNESGITKIEYSKDNGSSYVSGGTKTTYSFTGLKTGTYNFKVRCTNGSGLQTVSTTVNSATNAIGTPTYAVDKTGWQTKKVVTITYPARQSNFTYQYSLDGGRSWTTVAAPATTKQLTFTANGTVIARVTDGVNYVTASSFAVTQIDTTAPTVSLTSTSKKSNSVSLKATCTDAQSGITKIEFSKDNGSSYVSSGVNANYTFSGLKAGTYNFKARCTNGSGLQTVSSTLTVATNVINPPTYKVDKTGWQPKKVVTITYPERESQFVYQYSTDGGSSWKTVASPATTQTVTFTSNGTVIARIYDGTNYVTASSFAVTQVDPTAPSAVASIASKTSNSVTLKATCTDVESGITKIEYSKDNGSSYESGNTSTSYTFGGLKTGNYNFKVRCTNGSGLKTVSASVGGATNTIGTPTYSVNKTGWATSKVVTITYPARQSNFTYQYSLDGGRSWTTVAAPATTKQITFTATGTVIARVTDGTNYVTASSFAVTQIDTTKVSAALAVTGKTSNSVTLSATCTAGDSGITKYAYSKDNGGSFVDAGTSKTYTFSGLKTGTYNFKVRCTSGSGTVGTSSAVSATTNAISAPTYKVDKTGWQTKKVVTITYPKRQSNYTYQYSTDGGKTWKTVASPATTQNVTFTANGTLIARVTDGTNYVTASSFSVTQVDATGPSAVAAVSTKTTNSIAIKATCTDAQSGITKIEYSKDNGSSYVSGGTNTTYTFTGLKTGTYNFKVRCTNGSGMTATSTAVSGSTNSIGTPTYAVDKTGWQTKKVVTITYPARQSNFTYQYSLDGGRSWTTVASPATTKQVTFTANGTIIARITDGTNYVTASSFSVTQIDTSAPSATVAVSSTTYNSATLKATCTDAQSGITKVEFSKDNGASYVANGTNTTYTFGSLATGTYNFRARCTNGVGLQTQSAAVSKLIQNQFTLTYNANGGSVSPTSKKVTAGSTYGTLPTPTKANYRFLGWFTAASGGTQVSSSTVMPASNVTIYAHWQAVTTVVFNNDITGAQQKVTVDVGKSTTAPNMTASGYTRKSWSSTNTSLATVSGNTIAAKAIGTVTIRSNWTLVNPGATSFSGWAKTRTFSVNASAASGVKYYTLDDTDTSCSYAGANQWPTGYLENHGGGRTSTRTASKYICYKVCTNTNNYDGSNRCSVAQAAWVGADNVAPVKRYADFQVWYSGAGSWGASSYDARYLIYRGNDAFQGYAGVRTQGIRASWNQNMSETLYYAYYGQQNGQFANYSIRWGDYGVDTWYVHCKHSTLCSGQHAFLYMQYYDQDRAGNTTGWG